MATKDFAYDHPAYLARYTVAFPLPATAASTSVFKFLAWTDLRIRSVGVIVKVAGTVDAAGYDLLNGTNSVGAILAGTLAAASLGTNFVGTINVSSGSYLDIKTKAASATMATDAVIEFELPPGADVQA